MSLPSSSVWLCDSCGCAYARSVDGCGATDCEGNVIEYVPSGSDASWLPYFGAVALAVEGAANEATLYAVLQEILGLAPDIPDDERESVTVFIQAIRRANAQFEVSGAES